MARTALYVTVLTTFVLAPAYAQGRGGGHTKTSHGPQAPTATATTTGGAGKHGSPHALSTTKSARHDRTATTTTPSTTTTTTPTNTTTTNPIARKIASHPNLASRVTKMLPPGTTLASASRGFRNQGQFLAAVHVSQNLNIPFRDLKRAMLGTTTTHGGTTTVTQPMSLGQAIKTLRPAADAGAATRRATGQAGADVNTTTGTPSTTTPAPAPKPGH